MIYTVRKRPVQGIAKNKRAKHALRGIIYVPHELINTRVKVLNLKEYWEMKRKADLFGTVQRLTEEPWVEI